MISKTLYADALNDDDKFIKKIKNAIENESYDNLDMDEWEIIETLLDIIEARREL